jgi:hypothetical protein
LFHIRTLKASVKEAFGLDDSDFYFMETLLYNRFAAIYSPAHALAFRMDPFYDSLRKKMVETFGEEFVSLWKQSICIVYNTVLYCIIQDIFTNIVLH